MDGAAQQSVDRVDQVLLGRDRAAQVDQRRHFVGSRFGQPPCGGQATDELARRRPPGRPPSENECWLPHVGRQNELQETDRRRGRR